MVLIVSSLFAWFSRLFSNKNAKNFTQKVGKTIGAVLTRLFGQSGQLKGNLLEKPVPYLRITTPNPLNNVKFKLILRMFALVKRGEFYVDKCQNVA